MWLFPFPFELRLPFELPFELPSPIDFDFNFAFAFTATMNRLESRLRGFMRFRAMVSLISSSSCLLPGRNLILEFVSLMPPDADDDENENEEDANSISAGEES